MTQPAPEAQDSPKPKPPKDPILKSCSLAWTNINKSFVITQFIKESLDDLHAQISARKKKRIRLKLPSDDGSIKELLKSKTEVAKALEESLEDMIYQQAFVSGVSVVEDCITTCLREKLKLQPHKLCVSVDGEKIEKNIPLDQIIESSSLDSLLDALIAKRVLNVMYDRPLNYFKHLKTITGYEIEKGLQEAFVEIKASRDVLVHNQGVVNALYIEKAGASARAKPNEKLIFDDAYFAKSMVVMKKIPVAIHELRQKEMG